jgi:NAD dependent epimerase/dehydratase family enzyme
MHLILTGATGLVGAGTLHAMLTSPAVTKISILSRRAVKMAEELDQSSKVDVIIHKNFKEYSPEVLERLKGAEGCVWALGVSQNDAPDKA